MTEKRLVATHGLVLFTESATHRGIFALRTLIAPVKPAGKGNLSLEGLEELVGNM
jgi:chromosome partitioning protein